MTAFCCGAECGNLIAGVNATNPHWGTVTGTVTADTTIKRSGAKSYKFATAGAANNLLRVFPGSSQTRLVIRVAVYFETLPAANCSILAATSVNNWFFLGFLTASSKLCVSTFSDFTAAHTQSSAKAINAGQWYVVDLYFDTTVNPALVDWRIDAVEQTRLYDAITVPSQVFVNFKVGGIVDTGAGLPTYNLYVDDIAYSTDPAEYPIGMGKVVGISPNADGTHVFDAAGDFNKDNTTNVTIGETDTWQWIDNALNAISTFLGNPAAGVTEYLEWVFAALGVPPLSQVLGVEVVSAHHSSGTIANTQTLKLLDGAVLSDVLTAADFSDTTIGFNSKHFAARPSGGPWNVAAVEALRAQWGASNHTSTVPFIDGLMLEVAVEPNRGIILWPYKGLGVA